MNNTRKDVPVPAHIQVNQPIPIRAQGVVGRAFATLSVPEINKRRGAKAAMTMKFRHAISGKNATKGITINKPDVSD